MNNNHSTVDCCRNQKKTDPRCIWLQQYCCFLFCPGVQTRVCAHWYALGTIYIYIYIFVYFLIYRYIYIYAYWLELYLFIFVCFSSAIMCAQSPNARRMARITPSRSSGRKRRRRWHHKRTTLCTSFFAAHMYEQSARGNKCHGPKAWSAMNNSINESIM